LKIFIILPTELTKFHCF